MSLRSIPWYKTVENNAGHSICIYVSIDIRDDGPAFALRLHQLSLRAPPEVKQAFFDARLDGLVGDQTTDAHNTRATQESDAEVMRGDVSLRSLLLLATCNISDTIRYDMIWYGMT